MMRSAMYMTLSLTLAATGCLGGYNAGTPGQMTGGTDGGTITVPNPGSKAQQMFVATVEPTILACATCHATDRPQAGPRFLGTTGAYYGELITQPRFVNNKPASTYLIVHKHLAGPGMGTDPTATQAAAITAWITQENLERTLPAPPQSERTPVGELQKFQACMTLTDFNNSGMNNIQNQNAGNQQCVACHASGVAHNVYLSNDPTMNFKALQTMLPNLMRLAVADVKADGTFNDIIAAKRFYEVGDTATNGVPEAHGKVTAAVQTAVDQFFQLSYTHYKNNDNNCASNAGAPIPDGGTP